MPCHQLDMENKKAVVKVPEDQLSLAIGKSGQNVRLAAKLTEWNIDIDGADEAGVESTAKEIVPESKPARTVDLEDAIIAASNEKTEVKDGKTSAEATDVKTESEKSIKEVVEKEEALEDSEDK